MRLTIRVGTALAVAAALGCSRAEEPTESTPEPVASGRMPTASTTARTPAPGPRLRYLVVGGGASPESTEVSLEQNAALAGRVFGGPGEVLFAGGRNTQSVRVDDGTPPANTMLQRLGALFYAKASRNSRFRPTQLSADRATAPAVESALRKALAHGRHPLLAYFTTHGEKGATRRDNFVALWGGGALTAARLGEISDAGRRPLRLVVAACFSGGFAELAFEGTEESRGATVAPRCGLFAGPWNRETTGCDPNPDRRAQEGYSLHFLNALQSNDRHGKKLSIERVDFDGDGKISLLEAHTRARIASRSIDVPTTTSERYLRSVERRQTPPPEDLLPEERAVIEQLGGHLGLRTAVKTEMRWKEIDARLDRLDRELVEHERHLEQAHGALTVRLLERWPVLDDPYHAEFSNVLAENAKAIARLLNDSPEARTYATARAKVVELDRRFLDLEAEEALVLRLSRAYETRAKAAALATRGGAQWKSYERLLTCERWVP